MNHELNDQLTGSIAHATSILACIGNDFHALTDIARECNLGKSTVHRVLKLLEQSRFVVQDVINRRYYLGPLITRLASNPVTTHEYLILCANEEMKRLSKLSEETVSLDIMIGIFHVSLYEIPSQYELRVTQESQMSGPWHAGASMRVLLSLLPDKQIKELLDGEALVYPNEHHLTNRERLTEQIKEIRRQGYTVTYGERVPGGMCVSVPVKNYSMPVVLSLVGPEIRLRPKEKEIIAEIKESSVRISERIARLFPKP